MAPDKPVVYLLPGLLCDEQIWVHQSRHLAADADICIPDYRSCDSIEEMAQVVLSRAPDRFALVGHSMGARVAMEVIRIAPERVYGLALFDTGIHPRRDGEADKRHALVDLAYERGMRALAEQWLPGMVDVRRVDDQDLMEPLVRMVERMTPQMFKSQVRALLDRPDASPHLHLISCPVLIGVGRQDVWSPLAQHESLANLIQQADLVIFEDSGHMSPAEAPDAVNQALSQWLSTCLEATVAVGRRTS